MLRKIMKSGCLIICILFFAGLVSAKEILISGKTMSTTYNIKIVAEHAQNSGMLENKINKRLDEINQSMSIFIKDSEISRFNALSNLGDKFYASDDFFRVMTIAESLYKLTDGAWDGTVMPLVNLWGFGKKEQKRIIPKKEEIDRLLSNTGFCHIEISKNRYFAKRKTCISVDLASVAKGYAVDQIADLIKKEGINNFLVEIGGEVYAVGFRNDGKKWKVGINRPQKNSSFDQAYKIVELHDKALATSGDYRNFFEIDGKRYSHILNPKTGYPVSNSVVSVSIIADTCVFADGLATAVVVMDAMKGLKLINSLNGVECVIVVQGKDGLFIDYYSKGYSNYES
ncbi:MAG: FAD:protein FMN transferase [Deltaproteobacteria bacterium]|nr:FAD:protein FMN transferase [Deltaproteobacteria bacterium]MBW2660744.1 FAD:protein FMN transferase [Deltaproteobacteria bacterium]